MDKKPSGLGSILLTGVSFWDYDTSTPSKISLQRPGHLFFGNELAIVPFLHSGVVSEYHWLDEHQFVDTVAVAMNYSRASKL